MESSHKVFSFLDNGDLTEMDSPSDGQNRLGLGNEWPFNWGI